MRGAILRGLVVFVLSSLGFSFPVRAEPGTPICQLPQYRGTAIYNRYCGGGARPVAPSAPVYDRTRSFAPLVYSTSADFRVIKRTGRAYTAAEMATIPIEIGDTLLTGPGGRAQLVLPDETVFTLGAQSELIMDTFVFDPSTSTESELFIGLTKGSFRFVSGKRPHGPINVKVAVGTIGVRGTDVEFDQSPDGTGFVKLYSGSVELTPYDTDRTIALEPGQMITWTDFTNMSGPMPIR